MELMRLQMLFCILALPASSTTRAVNLKERKHRTFFITVTKLSTRAFVFSAEMTRTTCHIYRLFGDMPL
jgi:hypothetical protein